VAARIADPAAPPAVRTEALVWTPTALALPDADITVLCWLEPGAEWFSGWWDGAQWLDAASGGVMEHVTHWAEPAGPIATDGLVTGAVRRPVDL
jgi:hypothetical protein